MDKHGRIGARAFEGCAEAGCCAQCSANVGGDPAGGCDRMALPGSDLCAAHEEEAALWNVLCHCPAGEVTQ